MAPVRPGSSSENKFQLPIVLNCRDRYCSKCGSAVKSFWNKHRFCTICHWRTPHGDEWQVKSTALHRNIVEQEERFRREMDDDEELAGPANAAGGAAPAVDAPVDAVDIGDEDLEERILMEIEEADRVNA